VERASLARPWSAGVDQDAHLTSVSALCWDLCLFTPRARHNHESALSLALLTTASQARHAPRLALRGCRAAARGGRIAESIRNRGATQPPAHFYRRAALGPALIRSEMPLGDATMNHCDRTRVSGGGTPGVAARRVYQRCTPTIETDLGRCGSRSVVREPRPTK
jgi:hypothetical protein